MLALIVPKIYFSIIECNYEVINLSILVMYDVQYDVVAYGCKINWIYVFANHKGTTHMLNALVSFIYFLNLICTSVAYAVGLSVN